MFWVDEIAEKLKDQPQHVNDGKTPSGRIHVGSLRGVIIHDAIVRALTKSKTAARFTYIFDDFDAFDRVPAGLDKEKYEKYLGMPLSRVPSPDISAESYGQFFAQEFENVLRWLGVNPEFFWETKLHENGTLDKAIKIALDNAEKIQDIYQKVSGSKKREQGWLPFQPVCQKCGKIGTAKTTKWNGKEIEYECLKELVSWARGCGYKGKISPFGGTGKLPWKVYWPARWFTLKTTIEGEGKDLASKGGARDVANHIAREVYKIEPPFDIPYEFFLFGGKKMSTSKGIGTPASEIAEILPPELVRFLMLRPRPMQAINFDPTDPPTIPHLFDEYDKAQEAFLTRPGPVLGRIYELSAVSGEPPTKRLRQFSEIVNLLQMPGKTSKLKRKDVVPRIPYAKIWLDRFASEEQKFTVKEEFPEEALHLSGLQKTFLLRIADELSQDWEPEKFEIGLYELGKEVGLSSKDAFSAIYRALLGKDHGPKAAWLILSPEKKFVIDRFREAAAGAITDKTGASVITKLSKSEIFSIDREIKRKFPSVSIGVAIINGVKIKKTNKDLEKEKETLLGSLESLTTEQLGQYPEIQNYRRLYKETGLDWHSRRPSPEALLRRIVLNKDLYTVNTCVDAYNLIVMKHRVSIGAFDLDKIKFPTILRLTKEGEEILLLGDTEPTKYKRGEIAYFDQEGGFNMDFNYRDAQRTAVQLSTKNLYINIDGVFDITPHQVEKVLQETCDIITKYCGGKVELFGIETAS